MTTDNSLIDPCRADDTRELEIGLCAQLFTEAREDVRSLRALLRNTPDWHNDVPPETLAAFRQRVESTLDTCERFNQAHSKTYLRACRLREQRIMDQEHQRLFLSEFRSRTVYGSCDEVPLHSSLVGWIGDDPLYPFADSRDNGHLILAAGAQGFGKTVLATTQIEASLLARPPLTSEQILRTCPVLFHLERHERLPQLLDGLKKNPTPRDLELLKQRLGMAGLPIERLRMVVPAMLLKDLLPRLLPYQDQGLEVLELRVHLAQLGQPGLEGALGANGETRCIERMLEDAQEQGKDLSIGRMRHFIETAKDLNSSQKNTAYARLRWLKDIASPPGGPGMWEMFEPGVATVVYLGGPYVSQKRVLPMLVGLLHGLMLPSAVHGLFQRFIIVDEMNLIDRLDLAWHAFTDAGRLVRHLGSTLMLMGQDLNCVPDELFGLAELVYVFMLRNPKLWEHIRDRVGSLRGRRWDEIAALQVAEAIVGMSRCSEPGYRQGSVKIRVRPPLCQHGGYTRAMI